VIRTGYFVVLILLSVGVFRRFACLNLALQPSQVSSSDSHYLDLQVFDSAAAVVMLAGEDQAPGVASVDDDGSGIVDDRSELGASRSDDLCVVLSAEELLALAPDLPRLILQRGAFRSVESKPTAKLPPTTKVRTIVYGRSNESPWSYVKDGPFIP
jgi:hypothetical protein